MNPSNFDTSFQEITYQLMEKSGHFEKLNPQPVVKKDWTFWDSLSFGCLQGQEGRFFILCQYNTPKSGPSIKQHDRYRELVNLLTGSVRHSLKEMGAKDMSFLLPSQTFGFLGKLLSLEKNFDSTHTFSIATDENAQCMIASKLSPKLKGLTIVSPENPIRSL